MQTPKHLHYNKMIIMFLATHKIKVLKGEDTSFNVSERTLTIAKNANEIDVLRSIAQGFAGSSSYDIFYLLLKVIPKA